MEEYEIMKDKIDDARPNNIVSESGVIDASDIAL